MRSILIGFVGKARSGKDKAAEISSSLLYSNGLDTDIVGFADELKYQCNELFRCFLPEDLDFDFYDDEIKTYEVFPGVTGGAIMQQHGEFMRSIYKDYWVDKLAAAIESQQPEVALIKDVRHLNEADWVRNNGGILIKTTRVAADILGRDPNHISETALDGIDCHYLLDNTGPLENTSAQLENILRDATGIMPWRAA